VRFIFIFLLLTFVLSCTNKSKVFKEPPLPAGVDSLFQAVYIDTLSFETRLDAIHQLEDYFASKVNDSTTRRNYFKIANRYYYINDFDGFLIAAKKAFQLGNEAKDTLTLARGYYYFGDYHLQYKRLDSAFANYMQAKSLFELTGDKEMFAVVLRKLSIIYKDVKDYSNSERYAVEAIEIIKEYNDPFYLYSSYNSLGILMTETKNYKKALSYFNLALENIEKIKDMSAYKAQLKAQTLINMGVLHTQQEQFEEALNYLNEALTIEELEYQYPLNYAYLLQNIAYTRHKLGEKNVMPLFNKAIKIQDSMGYDYAMAATKVQIAEHYLDQNTKDSAFIYANASYQHAQQTQILENELQAIHLLAKTDDQNSSRWYETYINLQDSITNYERRQQEKFALIAFDTENLKAEKQLAESRAGRLVYQLWFIAGLSILLISFGFLLFKYRSKRLKNRELLLKQEELKNKEKIYAAMLEEQYKIEQGKHLEKKRLSRELHDGILGKLSGIRLNLFVLNKKKDSETIEKCLPYIKDLQEVEKEIRAMSHNLSEDVFSDQVNFNKVIHNLFQETGSFSNVHFSIYMDELIDWTRVSTINKIEIYRILQEGLNNIGKHAKANNVIVRMVQDETQIIIELIDDGRGMKTEYKFKGIGLKNMKERANTIKGTLQIDSQRNEGTTLRLLLPKKYIFGK
jgi:signal transduction histidine kinase/tetratricopeptide (TPR) repeat protein